MPGIMAPCKRPTGKIPKGSPSDGAAVRCKEKTACATVHLSDRFGWSHRLAWPRTEPSQGLNTGSNPVGTTILSPAVPRS